tara:strand:- start:162 stop:347 length:186 start_codon:yes stop_codon:yes gene_type:complete
MQVVAVVLVRRLQVQAGPEAVVLVLLMKVGLLLEMRIKVVVVVVKLRQPEHLVPEALESSS